MTIVGLRKPTRAGKLMAVSCLAMAVGLYPFCSLVLFCSLLLICSSFPSRMLVPLRPSHFYGSRGDNRSAMHPRNIKVSIELHVGHGALRVGLDHGVVSPFFQPSSIA